MEMKNVLIDYDRKLGAGAFCNVFHGNRDVLACFIDNIICRTDNRRGGRV